MIIFLFKFIFWSISVLLNISSRLFFSSIAHLVVLVIQGFKVPGEAVQGGLLQVGEVIKSCLEYILELVYELLSSMISNAFDLLVGTIAGSASVTGSAIGDLAEKTRTSLEGLLADLPELVEGFSEMVSNIISDLWNNCVEAVGYVSENA